jgi:hypothetical protein
VNVGFVLSAPLLDPTEVSACVNIASDLAGRVGGEWRNAKGDVVGLHSEGWWRLDSNPRLVQRELDLKDINHHFRVLLECLLPVREDLMRLSPGGQAFFDVLWESSYLYAGTGPLIDAENLQGIANLRAGMGFDIYQIEAL